MSRSSRVGVTDGARLPGDAGWTDSHCHVQDRYLDAGPDGRRWRCSAGRGRRRRSRGWSASARTPATSAGVRRAGVRGGSARRRLGHGRAAPPRGGSRHWRLARAPGRPGRRAGRGDRGVRPRLLLRALAAVATSWPRFATSSALAVERDLAVVLHVRDSFDDLFALLDDIGRPRAHRRPLLHRRPGRGRPLRGRGHGGLDRRGSSRSRTPGPLREPLDRGAARPAHGRDRQPLPRPRAPPRQAERARLRDRRRGRRRRNPQPRPRDASCRRLTATASRVFRVRICLLNWAGHLTNRRAAEGHHWLHGLNWPLPCAAGPPDLRSPRARLRRVPAVPRRRCRRRCDVPGGGWRI